MIFGHSRRNIPNMAEKEPRRRQPAIFKDIISNLEDTDRRNFERACEEFHKTIENILDIKAKPNSNGLRETETLRVKSKRATYDFWIAEEATSVGEAKNIVVKARPVSEFVVVDHVVLRANVNGQIERQGDNEDVLKEDDYDVVKQYTEMLRYLQEYLPDPQPKGRR